MRRATSEYFSLPFGCMGIKRGLMLQLEENDFMISKNLFSKV